MTVSASPDGAVRRWASNPFALAAVALARPLAARDPTEVWAALREVFRMPADAAGRLYDDSLLGVLSQARVSAEGRRSTAHALVDVAYQLQPTAASLKELLAAQAIPVNDAVKRIVAAGGSQLAALLNGYTDAQSVGWLERMLPYLLPVTTAADGPGGAPVLLLKDVDPLRQPAKATDKPVARGEVDHLDPIQGITCDCWLIAGLSAFAWTYPDAWRRHIEECSGSSGGQRSRFRWRLFSGEEAEPRVSIVSVSGARLVDRGSRQPVGATSQDSGELWPALVEKAYVRRLSGVALAASAEPALAHYKAIEFRQPHSELPKVFRVPVADNSHFETAEPSRSVARHCDAHSGLAATTRAVIAWTRDRIATDPALGLIRNHAYAVLGLLRDDPPSVMLRDPYGTASAAIRKKGRRDTVHDAQGREVQLGSDGVFACPVADFDAAFESVATFEHR